MCNYYQQALTQEVLKLYHELLAEQNLEDISAAATIWMKENRWYPLASDLMNIIDRLKGPRITIQTRALTQWRVVLQKLKRHGAYHPPQFSDPITGYLIKNQFAWTYLANMKEAEENWEQKRWCEAFVMAAEDHKALNLPLEIPKKVEALLETVARQTGADLPGPLDENSEPVPVDKIAAYRKMLEEKAEKDEASLARTNIRLAALKKQAAQLTKEKP
jgi:hypothetical protein